MGGKGIDPRYVQFMTELSTGDLHACTGPIPDGDPQGYMHVRVKNYPILGIPAAWSTGEGDTRYKNPAITESQERFRAEVRELLQEKFGWTEFPLMAKPRESQFETWFTWQATYVYKNWGAMLESPDLTNLNKSFEDAMTGLLWKDDRPGYVHDGRGTILHLPLLDADCTFVSFMGTFRRGNNKPPPNQHAPRGSEGNEHGQGGGLWTPNMN